MQEMKWGVVKKWKWGVFFCKKKWTFPQRRVRYVQYRYFLFYILLIWGGAYAPPPPAYGPVIHLRLRFVILITDIRRVKCCIII